MAGLVAHRTRSAAPHLLIQCPYCYTGIECLDRGFSPGDECKVECWSCERRILLRFDATGMHCHSLPVQLPFELLSLILAIASAGDTPDYSTLLAVCLVSKSWNPCATPLLYRHLDFGEWDARYERTILRTLALRPSLHAHVRSITADYPRLEEWRGGLYENLKKASFVRQVEAHVEDLEPDEARDVLDERAFQEFFEDEAINEALDETLLQAESRGVMDWMDVGDDRRGCGALELFNLAARCPGLEELSLTHFDFDMAEEYTSLPLLSFVRSLTLTAPGSPDPTQALLSRMPNLEKLDLSYGLQACRMDVHADFSLTGLLPHLLHFGLDSMFLTSSNASFFLPFIQCSATTLRSLNISHLGTTNDNVELDDFMGVLATLTHLETLSLELHGHRRGGEWDQPTVLAFFKSHTSLQHFSTMATLSLSFLESLPVSLISLSIRAEHGFVARLEVDGPDPESLHWSFRDKATGVEGVQVLLEGKAARTPALEKVRLQFNYEGAISNGVRAVAGKARDAGLKFELANTWKPIFDLNYY